MPLGKEFKEIVVDRAQRDAEFRVGLYQDGVQAILDGELTVGCLILRDFINATLGFKALAGKVRVPDKSLMRMFSAAGNPNSRTLVAVLAALRDECNVSLTVEAKTLARAKPSRQKADA